ncbi:MAG TPA: MgtC/SapB family protein [Nitrospirales bacterium]|nr:MgtC/SapB family protein [Nitrospirales bacterium]
MMTIEESILGFLVALAAGALIGLERQQDLSAERKTGIGGVRTFPLIALAGAMSAFISQTLGVWPIIATLLILGVLLAVAYDKEWGRKEPPGIITPLAALITFLLGVLALLPALPLDAPHRYLLIVGSAGVVMALLSLKERLHHVVQQVSDDDIYATAKFVILALVVLPLLPNRTFGPLNVLNPFHTGIMVVLIAGVSFLGYLCTRIIGSNKGLATTGIVGGFVSSTAVTISMATQAGDHPRLALPGAMAILGASSTMFARMLVIVSLLQPDLFLMLLAPLGGMAVCGYVMSFILYGKAQRTPADGPDVSHRNPFELRPALGFGVLYAGVLFISKAAQTYLGDQGLYASSLLAGTTDVDAIMLSIVRLQQDGLPAWTAATAVTLAAMTNTVVKTLLAGWFGGKPLMKYVAPGMTAILITGGLILTVFGFTHL